jgi:hypothetical protein
MLNGRVGQGAGANESYHRRCRVDKTGSIRVDVAKDKKKRSLTTTTTSSPGARAKVMRVGFEPTPFRTSEEELIRSGVLVGSEDLKLAP